MKMDEIVDILQEAGAKAARTVDIPVERGLGYKVVDENNLHSLMKAATPDTPIIAPVGKSSVGGHVVVVESVGDRVVLFDPATGLRHNPTWSQFFDEIREFKENGKVVFTK
jgi:hypothetical protein